MVNGSVKYDVAWVGFYECCHKCCLVRYKGQHVDSGVCFILLGCRGEDVYDGCWVGFDGCEYAEVYLCVCLYKDVDIQESHEALFCVVCSGAYIQDQRKTRLFCII